MTTEEKGPGNIDQEDADNSAPKIIKKPGFLTRIVLRAIGPALAEHDRQKLDKARALRKGFDQYFQDVILPRELTRKSQRPEWLQALDAIDARRAERKALAEQASGQSSPPQQAAQSQG